MNESVEWVARCTWPNGESELVAIETPYGRARARRMIEEKLAKDYDPGGFIITLDEARPLFGIWKTG